MVDAVRGVVETCVRRIYGDAGAHGPDRAALLVGGVADLPERLENQRVVREHEVAAEPLGLVHYSFSYVKTHEHPAYLIAGRAYLKSGVVEIILVPQGCAAFDDIDYILEFHSFIHLSSQS